MTATDIIIRVIGELAEISIIIGIVALIWGAPK